jgi:hypothetical protein
MKAMSALVEDLARSSPASDAVIADLARVQARQREAIAQAESLEVKIAEFAQRSDEIDRTLRMIAERKIAGTAEDTESVEGGASADSRVDLETIGERQDDVAALRREVQELMAAAAITEEKIAVDALQSKAALTDLLDGVRRNLKTVNEQKAMVDELNGRLASVQFVIQEAHRTLRMLNQERELVERIDEGIRHLRSPGQ